MISSKAGLLFGDVRNGMPPQKYLKEVLIPNGITPDDFTEYGGLYHTLNPDFYEIALNTTLKNLNLETLDLHYIHIPEISRLNLPDNKFYSKMENLFTWYEKQISQNKIRNYGIALEFMVSESSNLKWHFEIEKLKKIADLVSDGNSHFKYVLFEYNILCPYAQTIKTQHINNIALSIASACHSLGLETVASMPFAMGKAFSIYTLKELLDFALDGTDHIIVGSKNINHIKEIISLM